MGGGGAGQGRGATFHSIAGRGLSQTRGQRVSLLSPCSLSPPSPPSYLQAPDHGVDLRGGTDPKHRHRGTVRILPCRQGAGDPLREGAGRKGQRAPLAVSSRPSAWAYEPLWCLVPRGVRRSRFR